MTDQIANPSSIEQTLLGKIPKHTYTIPDDKFDADGNLVFKGVRELPTDPKEITLRQLTYSEELQALAAAETRKTNYNYEGSMRSIVRADGRSITWANNEKETFFAGLSQACRELVIRAFIGIALPTVGATADFLASERVTSD